MATVQEAWKSFLIESAFAKDYRTFFMLSGGVPRLPPKNVLLESLLPSLLQVKAMAILDAALAESLASRGLSAGKTLDSRIRAAESNGLLADVAKLNAERLVRNSIAHEIDAVVSWEELEGTLETVQGALASLGFVGPRPKIDIRAERDVEILMDDPLTRLIYHYRVSAVVNEVVAGAITWSQAIGPGGGSTPPPAPPSRDWSNIPPPAPPAG